MKQQYFVELENKDKMVITINNHPAEWYELNPPKEGFETLKELTEKLISDNKSIEDIFNSLKNDEKLTLRILVPFGDDKDPIKIEPIRIKNFKTIKTIKEF